MPLPHSQNTFRICMICNKHCILNTDLMLLKITVYDYKCRQELLLRCSKGHILLYEGDNNHIEDVTELLLDKEKENTEIDELKQEISLLKAEIEFLRNNPQASAPPLLIADLI